MVKWMRIEWTTCCAIRIIAGYNNGRFDLGRLNATVRAIPGVTGRPPLLGISEGGGHAAEALVLARYFMFTQVYFRHKTRVA